MAAAYGWLGDFDNLDQAAEFFQVLKKTYGEGKSNIVNDKISLNIDLAIDYMGFAQVPDIDSDDGSDEDDYEDDYE